VTLAAVSGLNQLTLSTMAGHQLPWVSILVPFWLVVTFVKMEGGTWKEAFEVWPGALCSGLSFAVMQYIASGIAQTHLMTDEPPGSTGGSLLLHRPLQLRDTPPEILRNGHLLPLGVMKRYDCFF